MYIVYPYIPRICCKKEETCIKGISLHCQNLVTSSNFNALPPRTALLLSVEDDEALLDASFAAGCSVVVLVPMPQRASSSWLSFHSSPVLCDGRGNAVAATACCISGCE